MSSGSGPVKIGELVNRLTRQMVERQPLYALWRVWKPEVGEEVASRARAVRLREGVLIVAVKGSAWMQELHFMKRLLISRLARAVPTAALKDIRFVLEDERDRQAGEGATSAAASSPDRERSN